MTYNTFIYIFVAALVSYIIRVLPLTLIRKPINNQFASLCLRHCSTCVAQIIRGIMI